MSDENQDPRIHPGVLAGHHDHNSDIHTLPCYRIRVCMSAVTGAMLSSMDRMLWICLLFKSSKRWFRRDRNKNIRTARKSIQRFRQFSLSSCKWKLIWTWFVWKTRYGHVLDVVGKLGQDDQSQSENPWLCYNLNQESHTVCRMRTKIHVFTQECLLGTMIIIHTLPHYRIRVCMTAVTGAMLSSMDRMLWSCLLFKSWKHWFSRNRNKKIRTARKSAQRFHQFSFSLWFSSCWKLGICQMFISRWCLLALHLHWQLWNSLFYCSGRGVQKLMLNTLKKRYFFLDGLAFRDSASDSFPPLQLADRICSDITHINISIYASPLPSLDICRHDHWALARQATWPGSIFFQAFQQLSIVPVWASTFGLPRWNIRVQCNMKCLHRSTTKVCNITWSLVTEVQQKCAT